MSTVVAATFAPFSSLVQVVYAADSKRFVVLAYPNTTPEDADEEEHQDPLFELLPVVSNEEEECVVFEVGEIGETGRWWTGRWTMRDVKEIATSTGGPEALETIISSTAKNFKEGMLSIGGTVPESQTFSTQTQTDSLRSFGPTEPFLRIDSPVAGAIRRIRLNEVPKEQGSKRAGEVLFAIATHISSTQEASLFPKSASRRASVRASARIATQERNELQKVKQELAFVTNELKKHDAPPVAPPPKAAPGRSLANPSKKARKVKEVEFADSDEEEEKPAARTYKKRR
ncbi:hypothetical protein FRC19_010827 [Serendipita sp. 401]|nr:hypothetical protein FRC19_010827 [Serendipita sp. 401]KAG9052628.1 hypothetical protein FS842_009568 [Serendipita sp. 407]